MTRERRKVSPEHAQMAGDRATKRAVICTICLLASACVMTFCYCVLQKLNVPENFATLTTFLLGNLSGILTKTGVDAVANSMSNPVPVTTPPHQPLETVSVDNDGEGASTPLTEESKPL